MQKAEERRLNRNKSTRKYYQNLKERAAQGDAYAQGILDRQRVAVRASAKQWNENHPDLHRQYHKKWAQSDRGKAFLREYERNRYNARKKTKQDSAE